MKRLIRYAALLFTIVFAIALLVVVIYPYMLKESGIQANANSKVKKPVVVSDEDNTLKTYDLSNNHSKSFVYPANVFRDPFSKVSAPVVVKPSSPVSPSTDKPSVTLTGVVWGKSPMAIIKDLTSNRTYVAKVGQDIDKIKILEIKQRSVVIMNNDKTSELQVWSAKPGM